MKVSGVGATAGSGQSRKTAKTDKTSTGAFAEKLAETFDAVEENLGVDAPSAVGGIDALLAAQGVGDATDGEERRRMVRYGEDLLEKLEEIRHGLLLGAIPKEKLIALAQMVRTRRGNVADPRLSSLLDEIELRAEVELAKLSVRGA
ncbi:flagellar assembly protein FliX [Telmatospirillum siberiense]|uniref:Flagellar assembly protein FliX n=1 Tax=Telmatospirillum siberiense TaxID=382514 RepID=A0A2N3PZX3_9PROT|nr:flagellar assembly protein FliX [Telmatospirillum siberiense]PKU25967.1 flagellar assembly protein FliX [Telmatospirillum siberiense]